LHATKNTQALRENPHQNLGFARCRADVSYYIIRTLEV